MPKKQNKKIKQHTNRLLFLVRKKNDNLTTNWFQKKEKNKSLKPSKSNERKKIYWIITITNWLMINMK